MSNLSLKFVQRRLISVPNLNAPVPMIRKSFREFSSADLPIPPPSPQAMGTAKDQHVTLSHPQLGPIKGLVPISGVHQFRSLPYATIPHRFADPLLMESFGTEGTFDATEFGPVASQPEDG